MYRMRSQDAAGMRTTVTLGDPAIQAAWIYDRPVDMARLNDFHAQLQRGRLGRVAAHPIVDAAPDRWTATARYAPVDVGQQPVRRADLEDWLWARAGDELSNYGGPAWRLAVTPLDDGGAAVSLVVNHVMVDGDAMAMAIAEAATGTSPDWTYPTDNYGRVRLTLLDTAAAARQLAEVALGAAAYWGRRLVAAKRDSSVLQVAAGTEAATDDAPIAWTTACVDGAEWKAAAQQRGGSSTTLAAALMVDLTAQLGRVDTTGRARLLMPVSTRAGVADPRGNAVTIVRFGVDVPHGGDLAPLRASMKQAFRTSKEAKRETEQLWRTLVVLPPRRLARLASVAPAPDFLTNEVSMMGAVPSEVADIDGGPAASFMMGLARPEYRDLARMSTQGGVSRLSAMQLNGQLTLRISLLHPPAPLTSAELRAAVDKVLGTYGVTASFW